MSFALFLDHYSIEEVQEAFLEWFIKDLKKQLAQQNFESKKNQFEKRKKIFENLENRVKFAEKLIQTLEAKETQK